MPLVVTLCLLGLTAVAARPFSPSSELRSFANQKTTSFTVPSLESQATCTAKAKRTNYSVPEGVKELTKLEIDYPVSVPGTSADALCCSIGARGDWYTVVDMGPTKNPKHKGQHTFICTIYVQADPAVPVTWKPANQSVVGGFSPAAPTTPDPKCTEKETVADCLHSPLGSRGSQCAWSEGRCGYEPPIDCGRLQPQGTGPFCIGIYLDGKPFPSGSPGRSLNPFNWTAGTISGSNVSAVAMPPQVLKVGQNGWFSMEAYPAGWQVCMYYNELLSGGKSSDPDTGIVGCTSFSGTTLDLTRGSSNNLAITVAYGGSAGWTANGFDGNKSGLIWAQFIFWSNSTTSAPH